MQKIKLFDVNKGERLITVLDGARISRHKIVKFLRGSPYMWDASTMKHHIEGNEYMATVLDSSGQLRELFNGIEHPIVAFNMTCVLEAPSVLKEMYKLNTVFSSISAETVYGNVLVLDIMCLPEDMTKDIQPDEHNYNDFKNA